MSRAVAVGYPHHITQRGNYRQSVFSDADDYAHYLKWLAQYARKYGLEIWAYCLPNFDTLKATNHIQPVD